MRKQQTSVRNNMAGLSPGTALSVLILLFFVMLIAVGGLQSMMIKLPLSPVNRLLTGAVIQNIFVFILPALIAWRTVGRNVLYNVGISTPVSWRPFVGVIWFWILGIPALNQIIYWNACMSLPRSLSGLERVLKAWESAAQEQTEMLLSGTSVGAFIAGILIIGLLTGFGEEIFFRGAMQRLIVRSGIRPAVAVVTAAFIFSVMHFQFYGFVPRLILGVFFGYLIYSTGSLWPAAFAHALNNSSVVVMTWINQRYSLGENFDMIGVSTSGIPYAAIMSAASFVIIFMLTRRHFFFHKQ